MKIGRAAAFLSVIGLVALLVAIVPVCGINDVESHGDVEGGMHGDEICRDGIEMCEQGEGCINYGRKNGTETYHEGVLPPEEGRGGDVPAAASGEMLPLGKKKHAIISRAFVKVFRRYERTLKKHFLVVSFLQATTLGIIGDVLAQGAEKFSKRGLITSGEGSPAFTLWGWFVPKRTAQVGLLSMAIDGIFTPRWYRLLERITTKKTFAVALVKTVLGSLVYGPFANGLFLGGVMMLRKAGNWEVWRKQLLVATLRDIQVVPPFELLNQLFMPHRLQPLGYQLIETGYMTMLSYTAHDDGILLGAGLTLGLGFAGIREAHEQFRASRCMSYLKGVARGNDGSFWIPMTSHSTCNRCLLLLERSRIWKASVYR